jgi:hypothetical protein
MRTRARLLLQQRFIIDESRFAEVVVWQIPAALAGSRHQFKFRLAFVADGVCVVRFDNETGKGDHKHINDRQEPYLFTTVEQLLADFWAEIEQRTRR